MIPLITIITVVYNAVNTIEQTIQNVINQDYNHLEYIIIDGGSTDGTIEIIEQYQDKITRWISEPDRGIYDAMNKGWAMAKDISYIMFLGSGDKVLQLPDMNVYNQYDVIYGNVLLGNKGVFKSKAGFRLCLGNTVHHQAMLLKKAIHLDPPFSLKFSVYADFDFNQRLLKAGIKFYRDKNFYAYASEGGVSAQMNASESLKVVRKNYGIIMGYLATFYYALQKFNGFRKNNCRNSSL